MYALTVSIDATSAGGVVLIIGAIGTMILQVINAVAAMLGRRAAAVAAAKADVAAENIGIALARTNEIHAKTQDISDQAERIAKQTDGQLSKLILENQRINEAFATVQAILSAREGKVPAVRTGDVVNGGHTDLVDDALEEPEPPGTERRQAERRHG